MSVCVHTLHNKFASKHLEFRGFFEGVGGTVCNVLGVSWPLVLKTFKCLYISKKDPVCRCQEIANKLSRPKLFLLPAANMFFLL